MTLGITGGTGCGKSTLLRLLGEHGALILDCDAVYHELLQTDKNLLDAVEARFPGSVEQGTLQRKKLGAVVFADPQALKDLNAITHAAVKAEVQRRLALQPQIAAIDAIALFEGGLAELCDLSVAVTAPEEVRVKRLMQRDGISEEYARSRISAQHSPQWFAEHCDFVLNNDGSEAEFREKCLAFLHEQGIITV